MNQNEKIERYILNKMDEDEASEFEAFYLSNQECIDQLEVAEKLYQGMRHAAPDVLRETPEHKIVSLSKRMPFWQKNVPTWSVAAMLILLLLPNLRYLSSSGSDYQDVQVVNFDLSGLRSENISELIVKRESENLILSTYIDTEQTNLQFSRYGFKLIRVRDNVVVLEAHDINLSEEDVLYLNLSEPPNDKYKLKLIGTSPTNSDELKIVILTIVD